jgi:hypothetical protein
MPVEINRGDMPTADNQEDPTTSEDRFARRNFRRNSGRSSAVAVAIIVLVVLAVYFLKGSK